MIQIVVLATLNSGNYSPSCNFILIVSLVSSIIPLVITGFEVMFQAKTLANDNEIIISNSKNTVSNPVYAASSTDIELQSTDIKNTVTGTSSSIATIKVDTKKQVIGTDTSSSIDSSNSDYIIKLSSRSVSSVEFRQALIRYYRSVAPGIITTISIIILSLSSILLDKVNTVDTIMKTYYGHEDALLNSIIEKYKKVVTFNDDI